MSSNRPVRRIQSLALIALALLMILPGIAVGGQAAPVPVEPGEMYIGASLGRQHFAGNPFRQHQQFEVSYPTSINLPSYSLNAQQRGYLINHETDGTEWIPGVHFGYALPTQFRGGTIRIEGSAAMWERDESHYVPSWTVSSTGVRTDIGGIIYDTGLAAVVPMIDGNYNSDGTPIDPDPADDLHIPAAWAFGVDGTDPLGSDATIFNNQYEFSQTAGEGDLSVFYDSKYGMWRFSSGIGVSYEYNRTTHWNSYYFELDSGGAPVPESYAEYRYRLESHQIGTVYRYSVGIQPINYGPTFFTTGEARIKLIVTELDGNQYSPGLDTTLGLNVTGPTTPVNTRQYNSGSREYDTRKHRVGASADLGLGISQRIWITRLTLHGGGTYDYGLPMPEDREAKFKVRARAQWGYYARATVDIAF